MSLAKPGSLTAALALAASLAMSQTRTTRPSPAAAPAATGAGQATATAPSGLVAAAQAPPAARGERRFRVKYRSASSVYLDGGRAQGLEVGDRLRAVEGSRVVAELEVVYVAEQSASCKPLSEARLLREGDLVVALARVAASPLAAGASPASPGPTAPTQPAAVAPPAAPALSSAAPRVAPPWARVRGVASFGYFLSRDSNPSGYGFDQRTARLDLGLSELGGRPLSLTLRARTRQDVRSRTLSDRTPLDERTDRLYEAALRYDPPSGRVGLEVGRIGVLPYVGSGFLDGGLARLRVLPGLQIGAFAGRTSEFESLSFADVGRAVGGFIRLAPGGRYSLAGYDATLAYVREDANGDVSREYLSLEGRFAGGRRFTLFQRAELDINSGWRREASGASAQLSNVSLSGTWRLDRSSALYVSYDGRRNYRYYLNRVVPEELFDDLRHQGLRAGLNLARAGGLGATLGFGLSLREKDPRFPELSLANAYSGNAGLRHADIFHSGVSLGVDGSGFSNGYTEGVLLSVRIGHGLGAARLLDLSYGRSLYRVKATGEDRTTEWLRLVGRVDLVRRSFVSGDLEYDRGDDLKGPRGLLEVGILF